MRRPREPDWRGVAAVLAILGVFAVLIIGAVYSGQNPDTRISAEEVSTVSTVLGAAIGAVAGYMAGGRRPPRDPPDPPELRAYCAHS
jgi:hypothetical protein